MTTAADIEPEEQKKPRSPWMWASIGLGIVCIGLLIWGLKTRSDLNDSKDQVKTLQAQLKGGTAAATTAAGAFKHAYDDVQQQLGSTSGDLSATQRDLEQAQKEASQAQKEADAAKKQADSAGDETSKAKAEADQAKAEAKAAQSQAQMASDCSKAYASAIGTLFEGDDPNAQASKAKDELGRISDTCKSVLGES